MIFKSYKYIFLNILIFILLMFVLELILNKYFPVNIYSIKVDGEYSNISGWGPTIRKGERNFLCDNLHSYENKKTKVLTIGDSMLDCNDHGAEFNKTIPYVLQNVLGDKWDVYNLAAGGWGTDQEYLAYLNYSKDKFFDYVILFYTPANDLFNNTSNKAISENILKPYFTKHDNEIMLHKNKNFDEFNNINSNYIFRILTSSQVFLRTYIYYTENYKSIKKGDFESVLEQENYSHMAHSIMPILPRYELGMELTQEIIKKFRDDVESRGSKFILVYVPTGIRNLCEPIKDFPANCIGYGEHKLIPIICGNKNYSIDIYHQYKKLREFTSSEKIKFIAEFQDFIEFEKNHNIVASDCIHFNGEKQASYVSKYVARFLLKY